MYVFRQICWLTQRLSRNPFFARPMHELYATFGKMHFSITISLWAPGAQQPIIYTQTVKSEADIPKVTVLTLLVYFFTIA